MNIRPPARVMGFAVCVSAWLASSACPIPQPLPEAVPVEGETVTPPRIVVDSASPRGTMIEISQGCSIELGVNVIDDDTEEVIEARWFLDYDPATNDRDIRQSSSLAPPEESESAGSVRAVPPYTFTASSSEAIGTVHVVELVVSNGFYPAGADPDGGLPNRTPQPGFETQVYRWVFKTVADDGNCP